MKVSIVRFLINKIKSGLGIVQDTDTATQAISKDKYVWWKGSLKKASSNIAATDTLSSSNLSDVSDGVLNDLSGQIGAVNTQLSDLKNALGSRTTDSNGNKSVPSGTRTKISERTISAGTYLIVRGLDWSPNSTGRRCIYKADGTARQYYISQNAVDGDDTIQQIVDIEAFSTSTTISIWGLQTSGASLTAYPYWDIVRLK